MREFSVVFAAVALVLAFVTLCFAGDAAIYAVHGVPGVAVDVAVDGECVAESFMYGDQIGPVEYSPGTHIIRISLANPMDPCMGTVVLEAPVVVMDDEDVTVVAHLDVMGSPTASLFYNDFSRPDPGTARIIAHHCAAAPAIDISADRDMDAPFDPDVVGLSNGDQVTEYFRPGEWYVSVAPTGSTTPALGPTLVQARPFMVYRLFAVGSPFDGSLTLLNFEESAKN
jgi:hypothetical protein